MEPSAAATIQSAKSKSAAPAASDAAPRDAQRAALQALVALVSACAAAEADIEGRREAATAEAKAKVDKANWLLEERYKSQKEATREQYEQRIGDLTGRFQQSLSDLKAGDEAVRRRIEMENEPLARSIKNKLDQAVWLADSVFEATEIQIREDYKQVKERIAIHVDSVDGMVDRTTELMKTYAVAAPKAEEIPPPEPIEGDAAAAFLERQDVAEGRLASLRRLFLPSLFVGARPYLILVLLCAGAVVGVQAWMGTSTPNFKAIGIALGAAVVIGVGGGIGLRMLAKSQVRGAYIPLRQALDGLRLATKREEEQARQARDERFNAAVQTRKNEIAGAKEKAAPALAKVSKNREQATQNADAEYKQQLARFESERDQTRTEADEWQRQAQHDLRGRYNRELQNIREKSEARTAAIEQQYRDERAALEKRWSDGLARIQEPISDSEVSTMKWDDPGWKTWTTPKRFADAVRFGELYVDLKRVVDDVAKGGRFTLPLPESFSVPASLSFPQHSSLLIQTGRACRDQAIRTLQMTMTRLLTSLPAGRVRFTIIDPVGLGQNFAGFMHLADYDEALVGSRIWTDAEHIDRRLADLTEHMETVIQKYLRNEFPTIDDYNAQAGELAEPYHFLVIADFPVGFEADAMRRLASIASSGARCGVFTLIARDTRHSLPQGSHLEDIESHSVNLVEESGKLVWKDEVFRQFPLAVDPPPGDEALSQILHVVGKAAKESNRVEVPFSTIAPRDAEFWSGSASGDVQVPIGRAGATRLQMMRLGRGVAQHALVAGKTGSGKSTLLHAMITNLAMWYSPNEIELYLIDFKKGVEFKTYAVHALPHARAIAVESDREFGLSVLQRLDAELARRGALFRKSGVQDLASYRKTSGAEVMPRTLLIIDEFQEFFSEDDKLGQDAALLIDRLVRQGRAFGIHVLLGSQTIAGSSGLGRSTIGQMAVRIALQTSEADSQLILGDGNSAARLLTRPGEAIYNDAGGLVEGNSPFQIAWLPDEQREVYLSKVQKLAEQGNGHHEPAIVFEGNAPADIRKNTVLAKALDQPAWKPTAAPEAWLGDPVAIKEPTSVTFRRQSGANMLVVGQHEEAAMAILADSVIGLAAQQSPKEAKFYVLDGSPADSPLAQVFPKIRASLPHEINLVEYRAVPEAMNALAEELQRRQSGEPGAGASIYVVIYGLQRYRALRRQEDSFSFSSSDEQKAPKPDKQFADLLREGAPLGIHVIAWCDTLVAADRTLDRNSIREFDNRVLFQMSAADSSNLIDSPAANKLGFYRALVYSEERGVMEKFRPYALPSAEWLEGVKRKVGGKK